MTGLPLEKNPNWKGGRTVTAHGYIKIKIPDHPNADVSGYVYEHRLVMESILGRYLEPHEIVHHINGVKSDNSPENLSLASNIATHRLLHRSPCSNRRKPNEENPIISCACGCGGYLIEYDSYNRPRSFIHGHSKKGRLSYNPNETAYCACGCGTIIKRFDSYGRARRFVSGHNNILKDHPKVEWKDSIKQIIAANSFPEGN